MTWQLTRGLKAKAVNQDPDTDRWISRIYGKDDAQSIATFFIHPDFLCGCLFSNITRVRKPNNTKGAMLGGVGNPSKQPKRF